MILEVVLKDEWSFKVGGPLQGNQNQAKSVRENVEGPHCVLVLKYFLFHENSSGGCCIIILMFLLGKIRFDKTMPVL